MKSRAKLVIPKLPKNKKLFLNHVIKVNNRILLGPILTTLIKEKRIALQIFTMPVTQHTLEPSSHVTTSDLFEMPSKRDSD